MAGGDFQDTSIDLEGITIGSDQLINITGLKKYEAELILLLGSEGHTSTIDGERIYKRWRRVGKYYIDKTVERLTEGGRGMRLMEIAVGLDFNFLKAGPLVTELANRTEYLLKLNSLSSRYIREHNASILEVVLTQTGTEMYERINAAVTALRL